MTDTFKYDVFISYSHADEDWVVNTLLPTIEDAGIKACIDFRDFVPGKPLALEYARCGQAERVHASGDDPGMDGK